MEVITVESVDEALKLGTRLLHTKGVELKSRNGMVLEVPGPVATVYHLPWQRVIFNPTRDANPFFHLMESMWILAGRRDVKFLMEFNKRIGDYSDDGEVFNAAYGYRIGSQLTKVIEQLRADQYSRQAVVQIWDQRDLDKLTKDKACNMSIVFSVRNEELNMTVYNRSNDMLWGAYGANVVQFSMIQEYVAAHLAMDMGTYTQVSNSFHVYLTGPGGELWHKVKQGDFRDKEYPQGFLEMMQPTLIEEDLHTMFHNYDRQGLYGIKHGFYKSEYLNILIIPVLSTYMAYKAKDYDAVNDNLDRINGEDWRKACLEWIQRRIIN